MSADMTLRIDKLPPVTRQRYLTFVADPPWQVMGGPLRRGVGAGWRFADGMTASRPLPYPTMATDDIAALPVAHLAADDAALYLWTINRYVEDAYRVARAWGFKPSTLHTWSKTPMGGGLGGAFGITTEYFLYCRRGSPPEQRVTGTCWSWKRHYINGKPSHSAKPEGFYDLVERVSSPPYVDLFARRQRPGWATWGNECLVDVSLTRDCSVCGSAIHAARPDAVTCSSACRQKAYRLRQRATCTEAPCIDEAAA